ncbi:ATP-binding protein [Blautia wexlerae]|uniref:sensor histidine kinase n=1 Tax=Blautia wexlerae TaxID=418240 RepID=UPI00232CFAF8|nr:ATP-binding protein [Blautia wexlerae]MDB6481837.1 ATP-binding protein [Blautia wexlerae]MDB6486644.1 ATP-binding protein [Blautia wexlerae]
MTKKIFKSIMFVCALVLAVGLAAVMGILYSNFDGQMRKELSKEATYLAYGVEQQGVDYLKNIKDKSARITYIDQDGTVLFDNEADISEMKNHSDRTEFQKAEKYGAGESSRYSDTLSEKTIYYALRLKDGTVLRVSGTQDSVLALVENLIFPLCGLLCLMLILSGIMASAISKRIVKPINELDLESPEENRIYEELSPLLSKIHRQNREIQNQLELAKQQQEEFALITENMQEGLIVIDKYTMILSANSSAWNLFHMDRVCQGESVYCLDREEEFRHAIEQVLSGEHTELVLKLNGSDIQLIANPVIRDKKTEGAVVLLVNVTEKLERESLRREFSANVSHELKTPLTSISGFAEIMQGGLVKNEDIPKFAGRIYKESQRLLQLVEDVIQISQLDEEKTSYVWEPVDVYQVCKNAFESLKEKAKRLNVHLYICGERMKMEAVRTLLEEAIYNVCDNAIKYNRNDGSVSVFLTQTAQEIQIVVKDTGVGIPKEDQDRVFERFYRVDKSHSKEIGGTGLGLSIVKHAVGALKGCVILRSEEGNGTEICMKFPKVHKE